MDGNGRWAQKRGMNRTAGHKEGLYAAKRVVKAARDIGIPYLSLYTFSTENWQRAQEEVNFLMGLIKTNLRKEFDFYRENQIRVIHSGNPQGLPDGILQEIHNVMEDTKDHQGLTVNLAINYGGRDELSRSVVKILEKVQQQLKQPHSCSDDLIQETRDIILREGLAPYLDHPELPDVDLVIRSGGEHRLSNFLLWQCSYAEIIFENKLWPDWDEHTFYHAIKNFQNRTRRFGGN